MSLNHTIFQSKPERKNADQTNLANSTLREAVIAVLIACRYLIDSLAQQLERGMIRMSKRSRIINLGRSTAEDVQPLIDLLMRKKPVSVVIFAP